MWYAGIDVSKHPELAMAAVRNGHVSKTVRSELADVLNFSSIPKHLEHANLPAEETTLNTKAMVRFSDFVFIPNSNIGVLQYT